jgi:hypothetical protein
VCVCSFALYLLMVFIITTPLVEVADYFMTPERSQKTIREFETADRVWNKIQIHLIPSKLKICLNTPNIWKIISSWLSENTASALLRPVG